MLSYSSLGFGYDVQAWDNALLTKVYDRIDEVYVKDHTKLINFMDTVLTQELRFAKTDQSKYFFWKISEYIHGKLYTFVEASTFVCIQDRVQFGDSTTIQYVLQYDLWFVDLAKEITLDAPSQKSLLFNAGKWQIISWIDNSVLWKQEGKKYGVVVEPRQGRGNTQSSLIIDFPALEILEVYPHIDTDDRVQVSVVLDGKEMLVNWKVVSVSAETIAIDLNHPLAWETLLWVYTIESFFKQCN